MPDHKRNYADAHSVRLNRVKEYIIRYKKTRDPLHFESILRLVDTLIVHTVIKAKKTRRYLKHVSYQEVYHTGLISLYEVIEKIPDQENPEKIPAWIVSYVFSHLRKSYGYLGKDLYGVRDDENGEPVEALTAKPGEECEDLAIKFIMDDLEGLVARHLIHPDDLRMLQERFIREDTLTEMALDRNINRRTMGWRVKRALKKVAVFFNYPADN